MSGDNPFEVSSEGYGDRSGSRRSAVTAEVSTRTIELLNQTRPWVTLMGILLWIGTVLIGIGAISAFVGGLVAGQNGMAVIGVIYGFMSLVYGFLAKSLTSYANGIRQLNVSESVLDLEKAIESQKKFWKAVGIFTLVGIVLYIGVIIMVFAGVALFGNFGNL